MAWCTGLSAALQAEINKRNGAKPRIEVIFDPDDRNIKLEGKYDLQQISDIEIGHDIFPGDETEYRVSDLTAVFNDPDNFFNPTKSGGIFRDIRGYLMRDQAIGDTELRLTKGGMVFAGGDRVVLCSAGNSEEKTVLSVDYSNYPSYDVVNITTGLTYAHVSGVYVYTKPLPGTKVNINLVFDGCADTVTLYTGYIESSHDRETGKGILKIKNAADLELRKMIVARRFESATGDAYYETNAAITLIRYDPNYYMMWYGGHIYYDWQDIISRTGISHVSLPSQASNFYTKAPLGPYLIEFTSATEFMVTGADCYKKPGTVGVQWYSKTDASDSFFNLSPTALTSMSTSGAVLNDWAKIYSCIMYIGKTVPQIIFDLLWWYGGVDKSKINASTYFHGYGRTSPANPQWHINLSDDEPYQVDTAYSFDAAFKEMEYERISISFFKPLTIMEAIQIVSKHGQCVTYQDKNGIWKIKTSAPKQLTAAVGTVSDTTNLIDISIEDFEPINEITVFYSYQYTRKDEIGVNIEFLDSAEGYTASYTYPESDNANQSYLRTGKKANAEINCPGIYVEDLAKAIARRYYQLWKDGRRVYTIRMNLQGLNLEIGDKLTLTCSHPYINTQVEVFKVAFSTINKFEVIVSAFDLSINPDKYAYLEDETARRGYSDEGFRVW